MPDILSQDEIDALLTNIKQEDVSDQDAEPEKPEVETKKVSLYDFKRPDKVSKEQIRAIKNLHDKFARNFSSKLSAFLRSIVEVEVVSVDQMTYAEFVLSLSSAVSFNVVSLAPLDGSAVFSIEPDIGFSLIDRLLGGVGEAVSIDRTFSDIEQSILMDVVVQAMEEMKESWEPIMNISFELTAQESSPNVLQIIAPSEIVVLVVFEIKMGETRGIINWCLPVIVLEPVLNKIGTHDILSRSKKTLRDRSDDIIMILESVLVNMEFKLGDATVKMRNFLDFKIGDTIILGTKVDDELPCYINGVNKCFSKMGKKDSHKAFKVTKIVS